MESRTKRNFVTRNAFHTCLCFPPPVGNEQNQEGKPCQERNKSQIRHPHASLPQVSRTRMHKEGQRSPGATGTDDVAGAPRAHPVHPRLFGHSERIATTNASNELLGDELAAL